MDIFIIVGLCLIHFVADFIMQTDWMAKEKSKCNMSLTLHAATYSLLFVVLIGPIYGVVNGTIHWVVDYITSRISSKLYAEGRIHDFFVIIGFDQFIHISTLMFTYWFMFIA